MVLARLGPTRLLIGIPMSEQSIVLRARLSEAERSVVTLANRGLSNRGIASERGTSVRTVAKQLASAYGKLGLSGRRALGALLL